jgi:uncharacterized SAM-binding protein YcdF (DUF218 family)
MGLPLPPQAQPALGSGPGRRRRTAFALAMLAALLIGLAVWSLREPIALATGERLETRFPADAPLPGDLHGIIVIGGDLGFYPTSRGTYRPQSPRIAAARRLAERFPRARIVLCGAYREAEDGRIMLIEAGIEPERIATEGRSLTTWENAVNARAVVGADARRPWALVTSAYHMPRAVGAFRAAGIEVAAFPVDRKARREDLARVSLREVGALLVYRLTGRSTALFPGPGG